MTALPRPLSYDVGTAPLTATQQHLRLRGKRRPRYYWRSTTDRIYEVEGWYSWPDIGDCPWARGCGHCGYGCLDEPYCQTSRPRGGWPSQRAMWRRWRFRGEGK